MGADRCRSCLMDGFDAVKPCAFCGISGCEMCIYDGDVMYNSPTCCQEGRDMCETWWSLPDKIRFAYPRGACAGDMTPAEAKDMLARMRAIA